METPTPEGEVRLTIHEPSASVPDTWRRLNNLSTFEERSSALRNAEKLLSNDSGLPIVVQRQRSSPAQLPATSTAGASQVPLDPSPLAPVRQHSLPAASRDASAVLEGGGAASSTLAAPAPLKLLNSGLLTSLSASLLRPLRQPSEPMENSFYCQICLCNHTASDGVAVPLCGHTFCQDCIVAYCGHKIREGQVAALRCPHIDDEVQTRARGDGWACERCTFFHASRPAQSSDAMRVTCEMCELEQSLPPPADPGCTQTFDEDGLRRIGCGEELVGLYIRFVAMKADLKYRECPQCAAPNTDGPGKLSNQLKCHECGGKFCYVHGDAHPGKGCRQFEREQRLKDPESQKVLKGLVSSACPNPSCRFTCVKDGGCNHITCGRCGTDFCWLCRKRFGVGLSQTDAKIVWHFNPANLAGCGGLWQSDDFRRSKPSCWNSASATLARVYVRRFFRPILLVPLAFAVLGPVAVTYLAVAVAVAVVVVIGSGLRVTFRCASWRKAREDAREYLTNVFTPWREESSSVVEIVVIGAYVLVLVVAVWAIYALVSILLGLLAPLLALCATAAVPFWWCGDAHSTVICDGSGQHPIVGVRYTKRGAHPSYDLCEAEYAKLPDADKELYVAYGPTSRQARISRLAFLSVRLYNAAHTAATSFLKCSTLGFLDGEMLEHLGLPDSLSPILCASRSRPLASSHCPAFACALYPSCSHHRSLAIASAGCFETSSPPRSHPSSSSPSPPRRWQCGWLLWSLGSLRC
jgi:hypothetical protein